MGLTISFSELNEILAGVQLQSRRIRHELRDASTALMRIHESDILSGRVKEGMNQVIQNQHIPILQGLYEAYRLLEQELRRMIDEASAHLNESSENAVISSNSLDSITGSNRSFQGLSQYAQAQAEFEQEFRSIYASIEYHVPLSMPSNTTYDNRLESLFNDIRNLNTRLHEFSFNMGLFRDFIGEIDREVNYLEDTVELPFYDADRLAISGRLEFAAAMHVLNVAATTAKWERVNGLLEQWYGQDPAEIFANLRRPLSEYEAWAWKIFSGDTDWMTPEERMAIGRDQRNNGFWMIAGGVVLIILTKGKAAPFIALTWGGAKAVVVAGTVAGFVLGGASIAFGTAEALEGFENMRLAEQGDIFSPSSNFLRDTLFNGNQELYNAFRNDASTATMIANLTLISVPSANTRPIRIDQAKVREISDRTGLQPNQVEDIIRHTGLSETEILAQLNSGKTINQILGVTVPPRFTEIEIQQILNDLRGDGFRNNPLRLQYEEEVASLRRVGENMLARGESPEEVARTLHQMRRDLGAAYKDATPQPLRDFIFEINTGRYGDPLGISFEVISGNKTFHQIIESSSRPNANIDTLLRNFEEWLRSQ